MLRDQARCGQTVRDTITGFEGVAVCVTTWLNGCVRVGIQPKQLHNGKPVESQSFDVEQLELVKDVAPTVKLATGGDRPNPTRAKDPSR